MSTVGSEPRVRPRPASAASPGGSMATGRRSTPQLLLGLLLVVVCALGFAVTALRVDPRVDVLMAARPIAAGQVLQDADLAVARIVPDASVPVVPAGRRSAIVGRTVRLPLAAGSLLAQQVLGPGAWPPAQQSVIAVSVKPGLLPAGLVAGSRVAVIVAGSASAASAAVGPVGTADGSAGVQANGVVVQVATAASGIGAQQSGATPVSVSLLLPSSDALRVARASGDAVLVLLGGAGAVGAGPAATP